MTDFPIASMELGDFPEVEDPLVLNSGPSARGWHRLQTAAECLQRYAFTYEAGPKKDISGKPPLAIGSLAHLGLAHHYQRMKQEQEGKNPNEYMDPFEAVTLIAQIRKHERFLPAVIPTLKAYRRNFSRDVRTRRIVGVEELYDGTVGPYRLTGRVDLVWEDLGGQLYIDDHKCLPLSAVVLTPEGSRTVEDILLKGGEWACLAYTTDKKLCWEEALLPVSSGVQPVYQVSLKNGMEGHYGGNHPLLTQEGWKEAHFIQKGDRVAVALRGYDEGLGIREATIPDALITVVSCLVCDGALKSARLTYTKKGLGMGVYCQALRDLGLGEGHPNRRYRFTLRDGGGSRASYTRVSSNSPIRGELEGMGVELVNSASRSLPRLFSSMSRRQAHVAVGSLWIGDGAAYVVKGEGKPRVRIVFAGRSKELCRQIQQLLVQIGIPATFTQSTVRYKGERRPYYFTTVVGKEGKKEFLRRALSGEIPHVAHCQAGRTRAGNERPSFEMLLKLVEASKGVTRQPQIDGSGIWWVAVQESLLVGEEECFNIEVPASHTFVANGLITHNSTSRITTRHRDYFAISGQLLGYKHLAVQTRGAVAGMHVNLIQHAGQQGTNKIKFDRIPLQRSPALERQFVDRVIDIEKMIERVKAEGRPVDQWPKAMSELVCYHRYGPCEYIDQCRFGAGSGCAGKWKWEG
jgi:hypothetical protein